MQTESALRHLYMAILGNEEHARKLQANESVREAYNRWDDETKAFLQQKMNENQFQISMNKAFLDEGFDPKRILEDPIMSRAFGHLDDQKIIEIQKGMLSKGPCIPKREP